MTRSPAVKVTALLSAAALVALSACGSPSEPADQSGTSSSGESSSTSGSGTTAQSGGSGTFTLLLPNDPGNLDPSMTPNDVARNMLSLSYDTLAYPNDDGTMSPGLASSWDATPTTVTYEIKDGVTCSDGSAFTAKTAAANIEFLADPASQSPLHGVFVQEGVKATADGSTLTVISPSPDGSLLTNIAGIFMICDAGLKDHAALAAKTIGTGPWGLDKAAPGDRYTFVRNGDYQWGPDQDGFLDNAPATVVARVIESDTTRANLLLGGEANMAGVFGPDAQRLDSAGLAAIPTVQTAGEMWFNHADGHPTSDPAVRQALTLAADRDALSKVTTGGTGQPSTGFVTLQPNVCAGIDTVDGHLPGFDPEKAKQVLDGAGWVAGPDGTRSKDGQKLAITFIYDGMGLSSRTAGAELLVSQWQAVGVSVEQKELPQEQLNGAFFETGAWDASWAMWMFNLDSQMTAFITGASPQDGGNNFASIDNDEYAKLAAKATPMPGADACPTWTEAEASLLTNFNIIPMFDSIQNTYLAGGTATVVGGQIRGNSLTVEAS